MLTSFRWSEMLIFNLVWTGFGTELSRHISDVGVENIQGMGYEVFCNWMNGKKGGASVLMLELWRVWNILWTVGKGKRKIK